MSLIWCLKHGEGRGFKNELAACVACRCRKRKKCKVYAEMPLDKVVAAKTEALKNGHSVDVELPLFEMAHSGD